MITERPPRDLVETLTEALAAGKRTIVMVVEDRAGGTSTLSMRTTPVSASDLHESALFLVECAVRQAEHLADGSGAMVLPHLLDAVSCLQAASNAVGVEIIPQTVGRA